MGSSAAVGEVIVGQSTGTKSDVWVEQTPFISESKPSLRVQSILYKTPLKAIDRTLESLARSAELAVMEDGVCARVSVAYGDCSPARSIEDADLIALQTKYGWILDITYTWFGENLGSARGHNALGVDCCEDFMMVLNPDVVISPRTIEFLLEPFRRSAVGMTEAKQLPLEHPKDYDADSGDTSWAATACAIFPSSVFRQLNGFDAESFFMYCDDVDFSWRVRSLGLRVIFQPSATVLHDKRLSLAGAWTPTAAERYFSAEAALFLAHKWSRPDLVERILEDFDAAGNADQQRAAATFRESEARGGLVGPLDQDHEIAVFKDGNYALHRFVL